MVRCISPVPGGISITWDNHGSPQSIITDKLSNGTSWPWAPAISQPAAFRRWGGWYFITWCQIFNGNDHALLHHAITHHWPSLLVCRTWYAGSGHRYPHPSSQLGATGFQCQGQVGGNGVFTQFPPLPLTTVRCFDTTQDRFRLGGYCWYCWWSWRLHWPVGWPVIRTALTQALRIMSFIGQAGVVKTTVKWTLSSPPLPCPLPCWSAHLDHIQRHQVFPRSWFLHIIRKRLQYISRSVICPMIC